MTTYTYIPTPTADESERRYRSWLETFTRRAGFDRDRFADLARDAAKVVWLPPFTIADAVKALNIPGSTPGARAQKLRRMERAGLLPKAHRSLVHEDRLWYAEELAELVARW